MAQGNMTPQDLVAVTDDFFARDVIVEMFRYPRAMLIHRVGITFADEYAVRLEWYCGKIEIVLTVELSEIPEGNEVDYIWTQCDLGTRLLLNRIKGVLSGAKLR